MLAWIGLVLVVLLVAAAFYVVLAGESFVEKLSAVRDLRAYQGRVRSLRIDGTRIGKVSIYELGQRRLEEVMEQPGTEDGPLFRQNRLEALFRLGFHQAKDVHHSVRELRMYSGLFVVLFFVGLLLQVPELEAHGFAHLPNVVLSPHVVPALELVMMAFFAMKLFSTVAVIREALPQQSVVGSTRARQG